MVVRASHGARSLRRNEEVGPDPRWGRLDLGRGLCLGDGGRSRWARGPQCGQVREAGCWLLH